MMTETSSRTNSSRDVQLDDRLQYDGRTHSRRSRTLAQSNKSLQVVTESITGNRGHVSCSFHLSFKEASLTIHVCHHPSLLVVGFSFVHFANRFSSSFKVTSNVKGVGD